jgi:LPXTG-site transpeptidase (sortase) family protein
LKLHNWVVLIGGVVTILGLANVVSSVSAISSTAPNNKDLPSLTTSGERLEDYKVDPLTDWRASTKEQPVLDLEVEALLAPSASFLAQGEIEQTSNFVAKDDQQPLSELYDAEMFYPQELAEQIAALPTPAAPEIPIRLIVPAIELDAPILPAEAEVVSIAGKSFQIWRAPDKFGVGWHVTSATLGAVGNTVLNGHHNIYGEVFKRLADLIPGDQVIVESESTSHRYVIANRMILPEKYAPLEQRIANAQWILPSEDERLTMITCWPYESNTHRLILVARPDK